MNERRVVITEEGYDQDYTYLVSCSLRPDSDSEVISGMLWTIYIVIYPKHTLYLFALTVCLTFVSHLES